MRPDLFEWAPHTGLLCITTFNTESQQGVVAFWAHTVRFAFLWQLVVNHTNFIIQGEKKEKCTYGRECEAACISWHPHQTLVAAGWKDGGINLLAPQEHEGKPILFFLFKNRSVGKFSHCHTSSGSRSTVNNKARLESWRKVLVCFGRGMSFFIHI